MEEAHSILHQIYALLGVKQCTATQVLGICLEFWVGAAVALGALKLRALYKIKSELESLKTLGKSKSKNKRNTKKKKLKKKKHKKK